ncbi:MAG: hypothetical protein IIA07_08155 [Proteobacteria bacterium]|nr:hypothetical protein [Pseudomonadota bacterium]
MNNRRSHYQVLHVQPDAPAESGVVESFWADVRLRTEKVDQDNALDDATATTLRVRIGFESRMYADFQFLLEAENISALVNDYNSTTNGEMQYSVVADPEGTEVNRVFVSYTGIADTVAAVGRQKIILDDARHIGNVGW